MLAVYHYFAGSLGVRAVCIAERYGVISVLGNGYCPVNKSADRIIIIKVGLALESCVGAFLPAVIGFRVNGVIESLSRCGRSRGGSGCRWRGSRGFRRGSCGHGALVGERRVEFCYSAEDIRLWLDVERLVTLDNDSIAACLQSNDNYGFVRYLILKVVVRHFRIGKN